MHAIIGNNQIQSKFFNDTKITPVAIPAATPSKTPWTAKYIAETVWPVLWYSSSAIFDGTEYVIEKKAPIENDINIPPRTATIWSPSGLKLMG